MTGSIMHQDTGRPHIQYSVDISEFIDIPEGLRWECIRCGSCCGNVFSRTWIDLALRDHIGDPVDGYCNHFDRVDHKCRIHPDRPNICRGYPFVLRKSGDHYRVQVHSKCKGIGSGPEVDPEKIIRMLVELCESEFHMGFIIERSVEGEFRLFKSSEGTPKLD